MVYFAIVLMAGLWAFLLYKTLKKPKVDGVIVITETEEGKTLFSLEFDGDPETIKDKNYILFEVVSAR